VKQGRFDVIVFHRSSNLALDMNHIQDSRPMWRQG